MRWQSKARDIAVSEDFLSFRESRHVAGGYPTAKWIEFCRAMLAQGFALELYEARKTFSKYLTVSFQGRYFKVRFSNHRPIRQRELAGDCDFFVGKTHTGTRTTEQAIAATIAALKTEAPK